METQIRTYMMYLDNLLKQLINYRMVKKERYNDDTKVIARKLISEVERVTQKIVDDVWEDPHYTDSDITFAGRPVKSEYRVDWKVNRALKSYEILRQTILRECASETQILCETNGSQSGEIPGINSSQNDDESNEEEKQSLVMKSRISEVKRESDSNLISFVPIDYDMEEKLEEYKNLASAVVISGDVAQIQNDINIELGQQKEKLIDADKEATKAVIESGKALEEVKIGSRHGWSWLPWKIGAIFGLTAGVGGGVAANVPGAVIGGATGVVTGAALGSIIKKNVKKDIDKFHPEAPTMIADSPESSTMTKKPKVTKKIEKN